MKFSKQYLVLPIIAICVHKPAQIHTLTGTHTRSHTHTHTRTRTFAHLCLSFGSCLRFKAHSSNNLLFHFNRKRFHYMCVCLCVWVRPCVRVFVRASGMVIIAYICGSYLLVCVNVSLCLIAKCELPWRHCSILKSTDLYIDNRTSIPLKRKSEYF